METVPAVSYQPDLLAPIIDNDWMRISVNVLEQDTKLQYKKERQRERETDLHGKAI